MPLATLVLLLIIRTRFPIGTPFNQTIKNRYGQPVLDSYRSYEKLTLKKSILEADLKFLTTCKQYNIIPKFLYFKPYNQQFRNSKLYRSWLSQLLSFEIKQKSKQLKSVVRKIPIKRQELRNGVKSWFDFRHSIETAEKCNKKILDLKIAKHQRKLWDLGINTNNHINPNDVIFNYSQRVLTDAEKEVLALGLDFALPKGKIDYVSHFYSFEKLWLKIRKWSRRQLNQDNDLQRRISSIAHESFYTFQGNKHRIPLLPDHLMEALRDLRKDPNIKIIRPDKGKGVVILNTDDYTSKLNTILGNDKKFKKLNTTPLKETQRLEDKLIRFISSLVKKNLLTQEQYDQIRPSGSNPAILYGLPKVHKDQVPLRPIMSSLNTFNRKLSKFLIQFLIPLTTNIYTVPSTYEFCSEIKSFSYHNPPIMASFDVESLFTNIPVKETINIIINELFTDSNQYNGFSRTQFRKLLNLACTENIFIFDNNLYQQIDGVAMGGSLGPIMANIFMCYMEKKWLDQCPSHFKPILYRRYVDDCFLLFTNRDHIEAFKVYLNSKHPNIKFTTEIESNSKLPFIGVTVAHQDHGFSTSVYRKPTDTGLGMNYLTFTQSTFKTNSILTLLHRCYTICSTWHLFDVEIQFLHSFYCANRFPSHVFWRCVRKFLHGVLNPRPVTFNVPKDIQYISLPFIGHQSYNIRNQLQSLFKVFFPQINVRIVLSNKNTIGNLFPTKERIPKSICSNIVYLYKCPGEECNSSYVGSTIRRLHDRVSEHLGVSHLTGQKVTKPSFSSIREHSRSSNHPLSAEAFTIIGRGGSNDHIQMIQLLESVYIKYHHPDLNSTDTAFPLNII